MRHPYRTIYETATGKIILSKRMKDSVLADYLTANPSYASINGICPEINQFRVVNNAIEPYTPEQDWTAWMRERRGKALTATDWTVGADSPLSESKKAEWETYRQALRDLPDNTESPLTSRDNVTWPSKPS